MQENTDNTKDFKEKEQTAQPGNSQEEADFGSIQKKNSNKKRIIKIAILIIIIIALLGGAFLFFTKSQKKAENQDPQNTVTVPIPENKDYVFVNDTAGVVPEEEPVKINESEGLVGESENFKIKDIAIGGGSVVLAAETEILPINVYDVRTETLFSRDQKETKLLISWKTNKLARSDVKYSKTGSDEKNLKENSFGFSHALVLNKLDEATRYSFVVDASDREGNRIKSDEFVVYTGTKVVSVFELISNEMGSMFSWAVKK